MKEYLLETNALGSIHISDSSIQEIILEEIVQVVGVHMKEKNIINKLFEPFSKKVKIEFENDILIVTVPIKIFYGTNVAAVATSVQERIEYALKSMLNLEKVIVHIKVEGLIIQN